MNKAIIVELTRHELRGGLQTTRTLWALGDSQEDFRKACRFARWCNTVAWSVEIVDMIPDKRPSQW